MTDWDIRKMLRAMQEQLDRMEQKLDRLFILVSGCGLPADLDMDFRPIIKEGSQMAGKKTVLKLYAKGHAKCAVMQPVTITTPGETIAFQLIDVNNNPVAVPDPTKVTTTLTDDNTAVLSFTAGADSLHWTGACTNGTTNVTAGLTFNDGSFGPFAASCAVTVALPPPPPPSPTDLNIIFTAA